jgi:acyl carrier protein
MGKKMLETIKLETKKLILESLNIEDVRPEEIKDDVSLLSGENSITIDSIDVLEVVVAIQKTFDVKIHDQNHARLIVDTVNTIAEFVHSQHHQVGISPDS